MNNKMIYLAVPYTPLGSVTAEERERVMKERFIKITKVSGLLALKGIVNFSPITQSHEQAKYCDLPTDWEFWRNIDLSVLSHCDEVWILCLDGWKSSIGVQSEIAAAQITGKPIRYIGVKDDELQFSGSCGFPFEMQGLEGTKI